MSAESVATDLLTALKLIVEMRILLERCKYSMFQPTLKEISDWQAKANLLTNKYPNLKP